MPLISIIVPIYNREKFLDRCISSIINQTYSNIEVILIDDGSTDNSLQICNSFAAKDSRIKVFSQKNGGVSKARNTGLQVAIGEYILFVDSDDFINLNCVMTYINKLKQNSKLDLIISGMNYYNEMLAYNKSTVLEKEYENLKSFQNDFYIFLKNGYFRSPDNKLYKKSIIIQNKITFCENAKFGEDAIFNIEYLYHTSNILVIQDCLYNIIEHSGYRLSNTLNENDFTNLSLLYNHLINYLKSNNCHNENNKKTIYEQYIFEFDYIITNLINSKKTNLKEELKNYNKYININFLNDYIKLSKNKSIKLKRCLYFAKSNFVSLIFLTQNVNFDRYDRNRNKKIKLIMITLLIIVSFPITITKTLYKLSK